MRLLVKLLGPKGLFHPFFNGFISSELISVSAYSSSIRLLPGIQNFESPLSIKANQIIKNFLLLSFKKIETAFQRSIKR